MSNLNPENHEMKRELGLLDGTMLVAGSMIGSGIFIVSSDIVRNVGNAGWLLVIWLVTGLLTFIAAVSYGELSGMFPKAGGQYVYLREAYGKLISFLYGWGMFTIVQTGTIAAVGVSFAKFTAYIFPYFNEDHFLFQINNFKFSTAQLLAILSILFLTWLNTRGVKNGKWLQTFLTIIKITSLIGLIVAGFLLGFKSEIWNQNWSTAWENAKWLPNSMGIQSLSGTLIFGGLVSAMVGSLFSSDAWNSVTFIAGEMKNPKKTIGLSLFFGTLIVTILYLLMNLMYIATLSMESMAYAPQDRIGVAAALSIFGEAGAVIIAVMIMISTFGCNNGLILSGARIYYSMAQDGLFFQKAGKLNNSEVPAWGLWIQGIWASVLCLSGKYGDLLDFVVMAVLIFYILTIIGIYILRIKRPDIPRSYKAFGYPILPAVYVICASIICIGLLVYKTQYTWPGVLIILLGIPVYYLFLNKKSA